MAQFVKKFMCSFFVVFLVIYMIGIFGPTELFFGNYRDLGFVFGEFGWTFLGAGIVIAVIIAVVLSLLPQMPRRLTLAIVWAVGVAAYIQSMFLNKGLESIGATAEGYVAETGKAIVNGCFWAVVMIVAVVLAVVLKEKWEKVMQFSALFLVAVQLVGYVTLFLTADEAAFAYPEKELCLSSEEQYTVSANENIIVLVLDNFANVWFNRACEANPELADCMKDFTYYNNADSNYYKTYPSLVHMLTGNTFNPELPTLAYGRESWENETTNKYFDLLKEHNYKLNVYTNATYILTGGNSLELLEGRVDNVVEAGSLRMVNYKLLYKTMLKMSCYRYAPDILKARFNVRNSEYASIVYLDGNQIEYLNPEYYTELKNQGLKTDDSGNYFVFTHLNGMHEFINDEKCAYDETITDKNQTAEGIFYMLEEYFAQLKGLGVYDNSTIIICADHGTTELPQPIFFVKAKGETHEEMQVTTAPIDYSAIVPTVVNALGEDHAAYGKSIYDYADGEVRTRTYLMPAYIGDFPDVPKHDGNGIGACNAYYVYEYTGEGGALINSIIDFKCSLLPAVDSLY